MNAEEITAYFSTNNTENTCGRFKGHQLNTLNQISQQASMRNLAAGIGLACLSLFSVTTAYAQGKIDITKTSVSEQQVDLVVIGTVAEQHLPLPGVNVMLQGTEIGTTTDFDGNFEFPQKLKKGDVLIFTYVGMDSQKIIIENKNTTATIALNVSMKNDSVFLMGRIASKKIYKSKRSK